jgi:CheY-like chemotaxis protein
MSPEVTVELIKIVPSVLWFIFVAVLVIRLYEPFKSQLLPRMSGIKAFGVEATFIQQELEKAAKKGETEISADARSQVVRRLQRVAPLLQGTRILWVDDHPENNTYESGLLRSLNVPVDTAISTTQALSMLQRTKYDVVISDIERNGVPDEGVKFLKQMREKGLQQPTVFYTGHIDWSRGTPPYAFGITNRVDHLLHYLMDIVEREKG